jgi:hypothetical protein
MRDMFFEEIKGDFEYVRRRSELLERKLEPLFHDLNRMAKILNAIQNHSDCTEELFNIIEEMKDYVE